MGWSSGRVIRAQDVSLATYTGEYNYNGISTVQSAFEYTDPVLSRAVNIGGNLFTEEEQKITLSSWGAGDSFKLTIDGRETVAISFATNVTSAIKAALEGLTDWILGVNPTTGNSDVIVTRIDVNNYKVKFVGSWSDYNMSPLTVTSVVGCTGTVTQQVRGGHINTQGLGYFQSTEQTGTGASQNIAHGWDVAPNNVFFVVTEIPDALAEAGYDITPGTHDATNIVVTVTSGIKFKAIAFLT